MRSRYVFTTVRTCTSSTAGNRREKLRDLRRGFLREVQEKEREKERERLAQIKSVAEARRLRLELREEQKKKTREIVAERLEKAKVLRAKKREVNSKEHAKWMRFRDRAKTRKIEALDAEARAGGALSLDDKEVRDADIDAAFEGRDRWDSWMQYVEKANSQRETRVVSKNYLRTGYVKWEAGRQ